jgi:hypothetical protein
MAHKSAYQDVLANRLPVHPHKGGQPAYHRSKNTIAMSSRLLAFRTCVANELQGKTAGSRSGARANFEAAARKCSGRGPSR